MLRIASSCLVAALVFAGGCFSERLAPPTFRHTCANEDECADGEACMSGLCQVPCTVASAAMDCPSQPQGYVGCINGACANACEFGSSCPGEQSCNELPGLTELLEAGVCAELCEPGDCADEEVCVAGFCVGRCDPTDPTSCAAGSVCFENVCVPEELVDTMQPETTADPSETDSASGGDTE